MSDLTSRASLAGAIDLSSLRSKPESPKKADNNEISVPDLVAVATEENLKNFVEISNSVPVVIEFFTAGSETLSAALEKAVRAQDGKVLLTRVDADSSPRVVQAFGVQNLPSVVALLRGQPVPLFEGNQSEQAVENVIQKLIQVASENSITGKLRVSPDAPVQPEPVVTKHAEAYEAMESGNYAEAVERFESTLVNYPNDNQAQVGLAQAKLLLRTADFDFERILASTPNDLESLLQKADACVAVGHPAEAYQLLLARFAVCEKDERETIRKHLLDLFSLSDPAAPELAQARKVLASLLY